MFFLRQTSNTKTIFLNRRRKSGSARIPHGLQPEATGLIVVVVIFIIVIIVIIFIIIIIIVIMIMIIIIFWTAFNGPGVLPDKADPADPQIPSSLDPAQGDWDDDGGVNDDHDKFL